MVRQNAWLAVYFAFLADVTVAAVFYTIQRVAMDFVKYRSLISIQSLIKRYKGTIITIVFRKLSRARIEKNNLVPAHEADNGDVLHMRIFFTE